MNMLKISIAYLIHKKLQTALSMIILAFGIIIITLLLLVNEQITSSIEKNIRDVDMVIGAKGSPMQIILSALFHIDFPTGNISIDDANYIARHRLVKNAVPLSVGDSYDGYRIIGTDTGYYSLFDLNVAEGAFPSEELEILAGATVARELKLKPGDTFEGSHGFADDGGHEEHHFKVVGILEPSGKAQDQLLFTTLTSYWHVHGSDSSDHAVTNLLIQYRTPMAAVQLPRIVNNTANLQAAVPAFELTKLLSMLGTGTRFLNLIAFLLVGIASLSIFISMYSTLNERLYDMAIFRALGATKKKLFLFIVAEGFFISLVGTLIGLGLSHLLLWMMGGVFGGHSGHFLSGTTFHPAELYILLLGMIAGVLGAILPAVNSYRSDISKTLSQL